MRKLLSKLILDFGKCPNQKTHESESAVFLVWALPQVQNFFESSFYTKSYIITILNFFFGAFRPKKWRFKKWISDCILKI